jgi:hypothetical protein
MRFLGFTRDELAITILFTYTKQEKSIPQPIIPNPQAQTKNKLAHPPRLPYSAQLFRIILPPAIQWAMIHEQP